MIGVRGLMNDYYAKDIGKKIRAGYRQKQKDGLVITPPFGYWKDQKYKSGFGASGSGGDGTAYLRSVFAGLRTERDRPAGSMLRGAKHRRSSGLNGAAKKSGSTHKTRDGQFLWTYASVKNVLAEEAYTGVLVNHRREYLGGKARAVCEADWLRHENFYPVIIEKATGSRSRRG